MTRACLLLAPLTTAALVAAPAPAHAAGSFEVEATISDNGAAFAELSDTLVPANRYLLTLTATGGGTCGIPGPTVQIVDTDTQGFANPVSASTAGACDLYDATVVYLVTWAGNPGPSGQFPVVCVWTKGTKQCTPTSARIAVP